MTTPTTTRTRKATRRARPVAPVNNGLTGKRIPGKRHAWTDDQVAFLCRDDVIVADGTDWIEDFRDTFGADVEGITDTAIRGKRQHLRRPDLAKRQNARKLQRRRAVRKSRKAA
jgi:hypothetical protein